MEESLSSILQQTFKEFEVIIVVNGPIKKVSKYKNLEKLDSRIQILKIKRPSLPFALNYGIQKTNAEIICRMDADDIATPDRLTKQYNYLQNNQKVFLVGSNIRYFGKKNYIKRYPKNSLNIFIEAIFLNPVAHPSIMFRKTKFLGLGGYSEKYPYNQDYHLVCKALSKNYQIHNLQDILLNYRVHDSNMTKKFQTKTKLLHENQITKKFLINIFGSDKTEEIQTALQIKNKCFFGKKSDKNEMKIGKLFSLIYESLVTKKINREECSKAIEKYLFYILCLSDEVKNKKLIYKQFHEKINSKKTIVIKLKIILLEFFETIKLSRKKIFRIKNIINEKFHF